MITEALNACGLGLHRSELAKAHRRGVFTAKRVQISKKSMCLAATAEDVQTYLLLSGRGSVPLWSVQGLLDQAAYHVIAWTVRAAHTQKALDKEFNYDSDN